jgi:hypothetical protein
VGGGFDHQFFDIKKLDELEKKENAWNDYEAKKAEWPEGKTVPAEFTEVDIRYKETLLREGFANWNKRDFFKFIQMCETYGRENIDLFSELLVIGKT